MTTTTYGSREGWYLWRLLIDRMHQGRGSPRPFYDRLGFEPTGLLVDEHETELVIPITN